VQIIEQARKICGRVVGDHDHGQRVNAWQVVSPCS
jgi:hypothetical protein